MCQNRFSQLLAVAVCAAAITVTTGIAEAAHIVLNPDGSGPQVTLADLLPGGQYDAGAIVGDKSFEDFFYSTLQNDMPEPENVTVLGFTDLDGNFGLTFQGGFLDLPGGGISDAAISFTVNVTEEAAARGFRISDAHLFVEGVGLGADSFFAVDESFAQSGVNDTLNAFATTLGGNPEQVLSDWVFFDELYTSLRVTKDILAIAGESSNQPARATIIHQSFSQVQIPEPATIGLVALGLLGIAVGRREF